MNETGIDGGGACITNPAITNDFPSLESFTVSAAQLGLPTFADAAAAAAPPIPLREKKPKSFLFMFYVYIMCNVHLDR